METTAVGKARIDWGIKNPRLIAHLDLMYDLAWANVKPFLGAERTILGVETDASKREIKNAFRRKARKLHPDVGGSDDAMKVLNAAYKKVLAAAKA